MYGIIIEGMLPFTKCEYHNDSKICSAKIKLGN